MENELKMRKDVPVELTWDLSLIYPTEEAMLTDVEKLKGLVSNLVAEYRGKLNNAERIAKCMEAWQEILILMDATSARATLAVETDYYDSHCQEVAGKVMAVIASANSELSFIESEIASAEEKTVREAMERCESGKHTLENLLKEKEHRLHPEAERVLKAIAHTTDAPMEIYNNLKLADMRFDSFEVEGKTYPLGYSLFEDSYEYDANTAVRRAAFRAFSDKLKQYENGTAAAYNTYVQHQKIMAELRGFKDMIDADTFYQHVPEELYHRQIDLIMKHLAPHMRKFARLKKKVLGLDRMTYADLKVPLDPDYCPPVTIEESRQYIEKGLAVMGEEYAEMIRKAYGQRWVDFAQNQGKSTGGFCAGVYQKPSFILMSWCGHMSDVFTLAHELGHAGADLLAGKHQSILDTNLSRYFLEAPSTMNEILMMQYLLKTSDDKRFRRWALSSMVSDTYYHNFVTHLLEAAYQRDVYRHVQAGGTLQAETLSGMMRNVLEQFWGDDVELTPGAELTWMRQPHYYMSLYSYTYSAGLTVATQMSKRIEKEGAPAVEDWKNVLKAGGTLDPVELAALGGVDITTDAALLDTIETIGGYIDEICRLTEELENE